MTTVTLNSQICETLHFSWKNDQEKAQQMCVHRRPVVQPPAIGRLPFVRRIGRAATSRLPPHAALRPSPRVPPPGMLSARLPCAGAADYDQENAKYSEQKEGHRCRRSA